MKANKRTIESRDNIVIGLTIAQILGTSYWFKCKTDNSAVQIDVVACFPIEWCWSISRTQYRYNNIHWEWQQLCFILDACQSFSASFNRIKIAAKDDCVVFYSRQCWRKLYLMPWQTHIAVVDPLLKAKSSIANSIRMMRRAHTLLDSHALQSSVIPISKHLLNALFSVLERIAIETCFCWPRNWRQRAKYSSIIRFGWCSQRKQQRSNRTVVYCAFENDFHIFFGPGVSLAQGYVLIY